MKSTSIFLYRAPDHQCINMWVINGNSSVHLEVFLCNFLVIRTNSADLAALEYCFSCSSLPRIFHITGPVKESNSGGALSAVPCATGREKAPRCGPLGPPGPQVSEGLLALLSRRAAEIQNHGLALMV